MKRILRPTKSFHEWQDLLAKPKLHWKLGYSAMTLAKSWEAAASDGFPPEVKEILKSGKSFGLDNFHMLLAIPEYQVMLPGGDRPSQADILVIAKADNGLATIAVEGKVDEPFGPTLAKKITENSKGFNERLEYLLKSLELPDKIPDSIHYQLIHRTVSALITAEEFCATSAIMLIHSFSPSNKWYEDFQAFLNLFNVRAEIGKLIKIGKYRGIELYTAWCKGNQWFLMQNEDSIARQNS
ncbi:MAG: hypothetical protein ABSB79_02070 [Syntrophales bacterium]|jgi:hypothetical protein